LVNVVAMGWLIGFVWSTKSLALAEERDSYDFGDSAGFLLLVAPVLVLCLVVNAVWAINAMRKVLRREGRQAAVALAVVIALWSAVFMAAGRLSTLPPNRSVERTSNGWPLPGVVHHPSSGQPSAAAHLKR
jgi:hypothetical protein